MRKHRLICFCSSPPSRHVRSSVAAFAVVLMNRSGVCNTDLPEVELPQAVATAPTRFFPRGPPYPGSKDPKDSKDSKVATAATAATGTAAASNASATVAAPAAAPTEKLQVDTPLVWDHARYQALCLILLKSALSPRMLIHTKKTDDTYLYLLLRLIDFRLFVSHDESFHLLRAHSKAIEVRAHLRCGWLRLADRPVSPLITVGSSNKSG